MAVPSPKRFWLTGAALVCALAVAALLGPAAPRAQEPGERPLVGRLQGSDVSVKDRFVPAAAAPAPGEHWLVSGSEVSVHEGFARVLLEEGGEVGVCGPASFSVLKSGGELTLAVNHGRVQLRVDPAVPVSVVTPFIIATPVSIGRGRRETVVGLEPGGAMCVLAAEGALRLEHQFTGERLLVPQTGEFFLFDGRLEPVREAGRACRCEVPLVREPAMRAGQPPSDPPAASASQPAARIPPERIAAAPLPLPAEPSREVPPGEPLQLVAPPANQEAAWTVVMPPLSFEASDPEAPPPPDPQMALLIREARVQPAVVFRGQVEGRRVAVTLREPRGDDAPAAAAEKPGGVFRAIGRFFKKIFGG